MLHRSPERRRCRRYSPPVQAVSPPTHLFTLPNGLTLAAETRPGPGFALDLRVPLGSAHDPQGEQGSAALLEEWLSKGAGNRDARAFQDALDDLGLRRGGGVGAEATRFAVSGLNADTIGQIIGDASPDLTEAQSTAAAKVVSGIITRASNDLGNNLSNVSNLSDFVKNRVDNIQKALSGQEFVTRLQRQGLSQAQAQATQTAIVTEAKRVQQQATDTAAAAARPDVVGDHRGADDRQGAGTGVVDTAGGRGTGPAGPVPTGTAAAAADGQSAVVGRATRPAVAVVGRSRTADTTDVAATAATHVDGAVATTIATVVGATGSTAIDPRAEP